MVILSSLWYLCLKSMLIIPPVLWKHNPKEKIFSPEIELSFSIEVIKVEPSSSPKIPSAYYDLNKPVSLVVQPNSAFSLRSTLRF